MTHSEALYAGRQNGACALRDVGGRGPADQEVVA